MQPHGMPKERPPWWPQDEPWPPEKGAWRRNWRRGPRRFLWRVWALVSALAVLAIAACAVISWAAGFMMSMGPLHARDWPFVVEGGRGGPPWGGFGIIVVLGALGMFLAVRSLRRTTQPIADVMDAAERVADGDYDVRVAEQGPRETRELARTFNDMTERLQKNEAQRRALLADVTHELRTPLTVMQGSLEALLDGVYPRDDSHLAPILEETRVLARLVEDLRTLSLAESGALRLHREPVDLAILIEETLTSFRPQADSSGAVLTSDVPDDLPPLDLDPVRIREVLVNLVGNALRHAPGTGVVVSARLEGGRVTVAVRDSGPGIPAEDLPHIFDRFYKSEQSRGMGLGLAIARNLVEAHGGEITAESGPGGTSLRFNLPVQTDNN